jgi:predicted nucleic acid-binding protein
MTTYALDTNSVSYFLKNDAVIVQKINEEKDKRNKFVIPPMVYFEIQHWLIKKRIEKKMEIFQRIYVDQGIGVIDKNVPDIAVTERLKLQKRGFGIEDGDLLIAAYCINHDLPLVTNNTKPFMNIELLEILNWVE